MRVQWNFPAFEEIRRLPAVRANLGVRAQRIAAACGGAGAGYEWSTASRPRSGGAPPSVS